jgi:hypothetical protein
MNFLLNLIVDIAIYTIGRRRGRKEGSNADG